MTTGEQHCYCEICLEGAYSDNDDVTSPPGLIISHSTSISDCPVRKLFHTSVISAKNNSSDMKSM